jgi:hypothetical protein
MLLLLSYRKSTNQLRNCNTLKPEPDTHGQFYSILAKHKGKSTTTVSYFESSGCGMYDQLCLQTPSDKAIYYVTKKY